MNRNALTNRPASARQQSQRYWGIASQEPIIPQERIDTTRNTVKLMKPDLTSHHFTRGLPKSIYKDKEQLYSEILKLKQSLNQVTKQNVMFKTKISRLESKQRKTTYININPESVPNTSNGRLQFSYNKQDAGIQDLKSKMLDLKKQNDFLKTESLKLKHTMKYTSLNELQIQLQIISDENKRLSKLFKDNRTQIKQQDDLIQQNQQLKKNLLQEMKNNYKLNQQNQKYKLIVSHLEQQLKTQIQKLETKISSLQRSLSLEKRKTLQQQKYFKIKINSLQNQIKQKQSKQKQTSQTGRSSSQQNDYKNTRGYKSYHSHHNQNKITAELIHKTNQQLEKQLKQINFKLEESNNQLKKRTLRRTLINGAEEKINNKKDQPTISFQLPPTKDKQQMFMQKQIDMSQKEHEIYSNQFQNFEELKQNSNIKGETEQKEKNHKYHTPPNQELTKLQSPKEHQVSSKDKNKSFKRKSNQKNVSYKINKKTLSEIKQLLTYRMKTQRYSFQNLKEDIQTSQTPNFSYLDLHTMMINEPFYLTPSYAETFLCYCYNKDTVLESEMLQTQTFLSKLRKVIDDFTLLEEDQQKQMIMRIVQMANSYPEQLHTAFTMIKNGQNTVSKTDLIDMFQNLELQDEYIEIIIAELSLCSKDLQHLNFAGFFQRFYLQNEDKNKNKSIQEQRQESQESYPLSKSIKPNKPTEQFYEDEPQPKIGLFIPPSKQMEKQAFNYDDNIVSDD